MPTGRDRRSRFSPEPTVLIVDDEETPGRSPAGWCAHSDTRRHASRDGREALRYLQQHPGEVRLVLTDVVMPYMDGGELAERARDLHPRLPIVLMSAHPVGEIAELVAAYPELPFLAKPFTTEKLSQVLTPLAGSSGQGPRTPRQRSGPVPGSHEAIELIGHGCLFEFFCSLRHTAVGSGRRLLLNERAAFPLAARLRSAPRRHSG